MTEQNNYRLYLQTVGLFIKEDALKTKAELRDKTGSEKDFLLGKLLAYYEVVSTLRQHAAPLGIGLDELQMEDIEPDKHLT